MKRLLALFLAVVMVMSLFAGCGNSETQTPTESTASSAVEGKTDEEILNESEQILENHELANSYQTYFSTSYSSLNYFSTSYATVREIVANCVDGLVEPDQYGIYSAALADSWDHNEDYTVWTFHIREGQKWIDHTGAQTEYDLTAQE